MENNAEPTTVQEPASEAFDPGDLIGRTLAGRYVIQHKIGRGGMGVVYLAQQSALGREVVIKVLAPHLVDDERAFARFQREARGLSKLQHPNIVTVFDFGQEEELAYIAMEYVQGRTLSQHGKKHGPFKLDDFVPIAVQILKGLSEAHKLGLVHRDIKPANIMLCELEGRSDFVKILDFGLAKLAQNPTEVTKDHHLVGSAAFLAPEQILNGECNPHSDVYALGVLFFLLLSGRRPFVAKNDAVLLYKHVNEEAPLLNDVLPEGRKVPPELSQLVSRCLSKDTSKRPADASALLQELGLALQLPIQPASALWSSGEFAQIPRQESTLPPMVPAHLSHEDFTPAPPKNITDSYPSSEVVGALTGQSVVMVAPANSKRGIIIGALVAIIAVAVAVTVTVIALKGEEPAPRVASTGPAPEEGTDIEGSFAQIESEIGAARWGRAENILDAIQPKLKATEDIARAADLRDQIEVGQLMTEAALHLDQGEKDEAIAKLRQVLQRNPMHAEAKAQLQELSAAEPALPLLASLTFVVNVDDATLFVDGAAQGKPGSHELEAGSYLLEVKAEGYEDWSRELDLRPGAASSFEVQLSKVKKKSKRDSKSSKDNKKPKESSDSETPETPKEAAGDSPDDGVKTLEDKGTKRNSDGLLLPGSSDKKEGATRNSDGLLLPSK